MSQLKQKIEALLFVAGRPVSFKDLAKYTKAMVPAVQDEITKLVAEYKSNPRGMQVVINAGEAQLVSHGDARIVTEAFLKEDIEGKLSRSALETLAIIAYRQPITRPEIDFIRGVNSSIMLRTLLMRGLIDRRRYQKDARMFEYSISLDFMKLLGISRREELPNFQELNQSEAMRHLAAAFTEAAADKKEPAANETDKDIEEKRGEASFAKDKAYSIPVNITKSDADK